MRSYLLPVSTALMLSSPVLAQSRVIITEIMYNPASNERNGETEWVEIANVGTNAVEIKDWRLDDEDKTDWGKFSCTLAPGGVAVLINSAVKEEQFRAAWDETAESASAGKMTYQVIPVKWGGLANDPGPDNEVLQLRNDKDEVVCEVKQAGEWPSVKGVGGPSIWLSDAKATDISDGKLWRKSEAGKDGARNNKKTDVFDKEDCGSPGYVPGLGNAPAAGPAPEPTKPRPKSPAASQPGKPRPEAKGGDNHTIDY